MGVIETAVVSLKIVVRTVILRIAVITSATQLLFLYLLGWSDVLKLALMELMYSLLCVSILLSAKAELSSYFYTIHIAGGRGRFSTLSKLTLSLSLALIYGSTAAFTGSTYISAQITAICLLTSYATVTVIERTSLRRGTEVP